MRDYPSSVANACVSGSCENNSCTYSESCNVASCGAECQSNNCATSQCNNDGNGYRYQQTRSATCQSSCLCPAWSAYQSCQQSYQNCTTSGGYSRVECYAGTGCNTSTSACTCNSGYTPDGSGGCSLILTPDFSLGNNGPITVTQGGSAQSVTITVQSLNGFTSSVSLSDNCNSSNLSCSWPSGSSCAPAANGTCTRTLSVSPGSASAGGKTVIATGTSGSSRPTNVAVTVQAAPNQAPSTPSNLTQSPGAEGSTTGDTTPDFTFTIADPNAGDTVGYQIQIDNDANFSSPVADYTWPGAAANPNTVTYNVSSALADGTYYWRVRARDGTGATSAWAEDSNGFAGSGADFVVNADVCVPDAPADPPSWSCNPDDTVTIVWDWAPGTGADNYDLQVDNESGFSAPFVFSQSVGIVLQYTTPNLPSPATYYGKVRAVTAGGACGGTSAWSSVSVVPVACVGGGNQAPSTPSNLTQSPGAEGSTTGDTTPDFTFTLSDPNSGDTVGYQIQIDNDANFSSPVADYTWLGSTTNPRTVTYNVSSALANGSYYWRVRTVDGSGATSSWGDDNNGFAGSGADFVVSVSGNQAPSKPTLIGPQ